MAPPQIGNGRPIGWLRTHHYHDHNFRINPGTLPLLEGTKSKQGFHSNGHPIVGPLAAML